MRRRRIDKMKKKRSTRRFEEKEESGIDYTSA